MKSSMRKHRFFFVLFCFVLVVWRRSNVEINVPGRPLSVRFALFLTRMDRGSLVTCSGGQRSAPMDTQSHTHTMDKDQVGQQLNRLSIEHPSYFPNRRGLSLLSVDFSGSNISRQHSHFCQNTIFLVIYHIFFVTKHVQAV